MEHSISNLYHDYRNHDCKENNIYNLSLETSIEGSSQRTLTHHLPAPSSSKKEANLFSILKNSIGKELSSITMPVEFNEPLSFLQRISEYMEYSHLLTHADTNKDPIHRLQFVCAFAVSALASNWERLNKPFNPLLGETYELCRAEPGFRLVCEQVSHHPPVSAFHAESDHFRFYGNVHPKLKFWGKSLEIKPEGTFTVQLKSPGETYSWSNVHCCVHNIIIGKLWFEQYGLMEVQCHESGLSAQLSFKPAGWFGRDLHRVEGFLMDSQKRKVRFLFGKWTDYLKSASMEDYEEYARTHSEANKGKHNNAEDDSNSGDTPTKKISSKLNILTRSFTRGGDKSPEPPVSPHDPESLSDGEGSVPRSDSTLSLDIPNAVTLWRVQPRPEDSDKYYNFTGFAMSLNEMTDELSVRLPRTDCRFRPDIRKLEEGDTGEYNDPESLSDGEGSVPRSDSTLSLDIPNAVTLWRVQPRPEDSDKYYNFTGFAMSLNEMTDELSVRLPRTDCRFRPDIRKLEEGDTDGAACEKNRLEEKQREARKQRKRRKDAWNPRWFRVGRVPHIKNDVWLFNDQYWAREFSDCPDIF